MFLVINLHDDRNDEVWLNMLKPIIISSEWWSSYRILHLSHLSVALFKNSFVLLVENYSLNAFVFS